MLVTGRILTVALSVFVANPALARDAWIAGHVQGSVFALSGDEWVEMRDGDAVPSGTVVRTLQTGTVAVRRGQASLELDPNSAVRPTDDVNAGITIEQFSGEVTLNTGASKYTLILPHLVAAATQASLSASISNTLSAITVRNGQVRVWVNGKQQVLSKGQTISVGATTLAAPSPSESVSGSLPTVPPPPVAPVAVVKTDNGLGNGGLPGNGGQLGKGSAGPNAKGNK